jgi:hypothetical protein
VRTNNKILLWLLDDFIEGLEKRGAAEFDSHDILYPQTLITLGIDITFLLPPMMRGSPTTATPLD